MKYEIRVHDEVIGTTGLEAGDPPMGFVSGAVEPSASYRKIPESQEVSIHVLDTGEEVRCQSATIEDSTEEHGEVCVEITVLVESAEEYEKFFKHHLEAYEKQFK